jgi:YVTN family beta-propeller protein
VGNTVDAIDAETGRFIANIFVGSFPEGMALSTDGKRLFVANRNSDTLSVVDVALMSEIATIAVGDAPVSVDVHPDGSRIYVVNNWSDHVSVIDAVTLRPVADVQIGPNGAAIGRFVGPRQGDRPGNLSGMWWNPSESGWGVHLTQRRDVIFAAWFTYDDLGLPIWIVASDCRIAALAVAEPTCTGKLYGTSGPRFFGRPFDPSAVLASEIGTLTLRFSASGTATMAYNVGDIQRTVTLQRQVQSGDPVPPAVYTDLWWNPAESGWGLAVHEQRTSLFLAWFVYDNAGDSTWYVASNCAKNASGSSCTGALYRATGPRFGPTFDATAVRLFEVGTVTLTFGSADNAVLSYTVDGQPGTKTVTRQRF